MKKLLAKDYWIIIVLVITMIAGPAKAQQTQHIVIGKMLAAEVSEGIILRTTSGLKDTFGYFITLNFLIHMKTLKLLLLGAMFSNLGNNPVGVQDSPTRKFTILTQLTTQPISSGLSVPAMLNAPGNEKLKAFFLTPVEDRQRLKGKKIAVIATDGFEEIELLGPMWYFRELGAQVDIVAPKYNPAPARYGLTIPEIAKDHIMAIQYLTPVGWVKVDRTADKIKVNEYDAIFIPGGAWNPDNLRFDKDVIRFIQNFFQAGKLIAAICHAPVVLATGGILKGKKLAGYWNIQSDLSNAGGIVSDVPVVVDVNLITRRHPIDVADFSHSVTDWLTKH